MGSVLKLVFDNWVIKNGIKEPLPNGRHPLVNIEIQKIVQSVDIFPVYDSLSKVNGSHEIGVFDHSNFYGYFSRIKGNQNVIDVTDVIDDGTIYIYPIELRGNTSSLYDKTSFTLNGVNITHYLIDTMSDHAISLLKQGKIKFLINIVHDPIPIELALKIEKYFSSMGIDPHNVILLAGNDLNEKRQQSYPESKLVLVYSLDLLMQQMGNCLTSYPRTTTLGYVSDLLRESDLDITIKRPHKFLSFNRTMREHRCALFYFAFTNNLLNDNIFSFLNHDSSNVEYLMSSLPKYFNDVDIKVVEKIVEMLPYQIDTHSMGTLRQYNFSMDNTLKEFYEKTYISLVTETAFDDYTVFISEKLWKPIMNLHPFILIGSYGLLEYIRSLGFKTFSPFIDESYDSVRDPVERYNLIFNEINKLNSMSIDEIHDWYYSITDILIYNQNHLLTFKNMDPFQTVYDQIIKVYNENNL